MTVRELIHELSKQDQELDVLVHGVYPSGGDILRVEVRHNQWGNKIHVVLTSDTMIG